MRKRVYFLYYYIVVIVVGPVEIVDNFFRHSKCLLIYCFYSVDNLFFLYTAYVNNYCMVSFRRLISSASKLFVFISEEILSQA